MLVSVVVVMEIARHVQRCCVFFFNAFIFVEIVLPVKFYRIIDVSGL